MTMDRNSAMTPDAVSEKMSGSPLAGAITLACYARRPKDEDGLKRALEQIEPREHAHLRRLGNLLVEAAG